jgi:hypothetical protein
LRTQLQAQLRAKENRDVGMIITPPNKRCSDLTARQKAPFVLRGIVQFALLAAALVDTYRRPAQEINGSKWLWGTAALANFMGIGPIAYFLFGRKRRDRAR